MSTLDKLKQKLNLTGASKGLENLSSAARRVDISPLGHAAETVKMKFSALEVMGVTALANITNSAVNAGKRIVSALTIDPVKTGFNEYELKMDSVKTIMASTGESIETVNGHLEELNKYSDQTIYSFADMTQNIGKFTNAGVKLEDAVLAIKGISNEAAVSGANANEASRAMYNFAQALSAGHVKLIDWKSIENANMATVEFKQQLIDTAVELGTVTKSADGMYKTLDGNAFNATKNFNDVLQDQWMTSEVLVETLKDYADETTEIGKKAFAAAQDVTKLTQVWDILKETAQSGWAKTWELIFGDINQAKAIFTPLTEFFSNIINKISDFRNSLIEGALGSPLGKLATKLGEYGKATGKAVEKTKELGDIVNRVIRGEFGNTEKRWNKLTEMGYNWAQVQNKVNEQLGYSKRHNEKLGESQKSLNKTQGETIEQLLKLSDAKLKDKGFTEAEIKALRELQEEAKRTGKPIEELIDKMGQPKTGRELLIESFKNAGKGLIEVISAIKKAWVDIFPPKSMDERVANLYNGISKIAEFTKKLIPSADTVDKLTRTFKGLFAVIDIITDITGGAFKIAIQVIGKLLGIVDVDILSVTAKIGDLLVKFRDWLHSNGLINKAVDKLVVGIKAAYKFISKWIKVFFDLPVVKGFIEDFKKTFTLDNIVNGVKTAYATVKKWIGLFMELPLVQKVISKFKDAATGAFDIGKNIVASIKGGYFLSYMSELGSNAMAALKKGFAKVGEIGKNIVKGLVKGIKDGSIWQAIKDFANKIIDTVCDILGIHSPSRVFEWIGENIILGLINGIKWAVSNVFSLLESILSTVIGMFGNLGAQIVDAFKGLNINWDKLLQIGSTGGMLVILYNLIMAFKNLTKPLVGFTEVLSGVAGILGEVPKILKTVPKVMKGFNKVLKSFAFSIKAKALKDVAVAIMMLVGTIVVLALFAKNHSTDMWKAVAMLGALSAVLIVLAYTMTEFAMKSVTTEGPKDQIKQIMNIGKIATAFLAISGSLLLAAFAMGKISKIKNMDQAIVGTAFLMAGLTALVILMGKFMNGNQMKNVDKVGVTIFKISGAILLLTFTAKMMAKFLKDVDPDILPRMNWMIGGLAVLVAGLTATTLLAGKHIDKAGSTLLKMAIAVGVLALVAHMVAKFVKENKGFDIADAMAVMTGMVGFTMLLCLGLRAIEKPLENVGKSILAMAISIGILALVTKMMASFVKNTPPEVIDGALQIVTGLVLFVGILVVALTTIEKPLEQVGKAMLGLAAVIGTMAVVIAVMGLLDEGQLLKGGIVVLAISAFIAGLVYVIGQCDPLGQAQKALIGIAIAVGVIAAAVAVLSFIDPTNLTNATVAIGILMGIMTGMLYVSSLIKADGKLIATLSVLVGALLIMAIAVKIIGGMPIESAVAGTVGLSVMMLALGAAMVMVSNYNGSILKALPAIVTMLLVVGVLGAVMQMLTGMDYTNALVAAVGISLMLATLSGAILMISKSGAFNLTNMVSFGASILILAGGIIILTQAFKQFSQMSWEGIAKSIVSMAGAIAILAIGLNLMTGTLAGSAALIVASGALYILAQAMTVLATMSLTEVGIGLIAIAGALAILGIAGAVAGPAMMIAGAALLLLGTACLAASVGALMFAGAINLLVGVPLTDIASGLVALSGAFLALTATSLTLILAAPLILVFSAALLALGAGSVIAAPGTMLLAAALAMLSAIPLGGMAGNITLLAGAVALLGAASLTLAVAAPLMFLLSGALTAVGVGCTVTAAGLALLALAIAAFVGASTAALSGAVEKFKNVGKNLMDGGLIKGISSRIGSVLKTVKQIPSKCLDFLKTKIADFKNIAKNLIDGFINGIKSKINDATSAVKNVASSAVEGIKNFLGINSPSRLFAQIGAFTGEGFVEGLSSTEFDVANAAESLGATASGAFNNSLDFDEVNVDFASFDGLSDIQNYDFSNIEDLSNTDFSNMSDLSGYDFSNVEGLGEINLGEVNVSGSTGSSYVEAGAVIQEATGQVETLEETLKRYQEACDAIWRGEWGHGWNKGDERYENVISHGLDPELLRELVNKGSDYEVVIDDIKNAKERLDATIKEIRAPYEWEDKTDDKWIVYGNRAYDQSSIAKLRQEADKTNEVLEVVKDYQNERWESGIVTSDRSPLEEALSKGNRTDQGVAQAIEKNVQEQGEAYAKLREEYDKMQEQRAAVINDVLFGSKTTEADLREEADKNQKERADTVLSIINAETKRMKEEQKTAAEAYGAAYAKIQQEAHFTNPLDYVAYWKTGKQSPFKEYLEELRKLRTEATIEGVKNITNALSGYGKELYKAGSEIANPAINGLKDAFKRIGEFVDSDMGSEPTIRPVLDLSEVESGVGLINSMLGLNPSIGLLTNVGKISSSMNQQNQNGSFNDVVSAVDKLGTKVDNMEKPSYVINGITYDDGSAVSEVVKQLIRSVKIERRT